MATPVNIIQVGLGPIGIETARRAAARPELRLAGGVDTSPALAEQKLADVLGDEAAVGGTVASNLQEALETFEPEVALVATTSDLASVAPTLKELLLAGVHVVSTCEELLYPWIRHPELAREIDEAGVAGSAACVGLGINPGFVLDFLPLVLTGPVDRVESIKAWRVVDAGSRRGPLQRKIGAGLTKEEFEQRVAEGGIGHRGMEESLHLVCRALGVELLGASSFIRPILAEEDVETEVVRVPAGRVAGIHQGAEDRDGRVVLDLKMSVGARDPQDRIEITGQPEVRAVIEGGYQGDRSTCAAALNAVPSVIDAKPGLRTLLDLPLIHARSLVPLD